MCFDTVNHNEYLSDIKNSPQPKTLFFDSRDQTEPFILGRP